MYDEVILVLCGVSLEVPQGKIVTLLGPNGAGKSTTLKAISGLLKTEDGKVTRGDINFMGQQIANGNPEDIVRSGLFQVMEGRRIIEDMTCVENLRLGAYTRKDKGVKDDIDMVFEYFPRLRERTGLAGYLSGGEQQMLAFGRAMIARPELILMDEPSLGLAPKVVAEIFDTIKRLNQEDGTAILLVEQNAGVAFSVADYGYIMESGQIVMEGDVAKLRGDKDIQSFYLGMGEEGGARQSFRDVKHYKRRKRWLS